MLHTFPAGILKYSTTCSKIQKTGMQQVITGDIQWERKILKHYLNVYLPHLSGQTMHV